ncbi:thiamine phosphate synthase [Planococcus halotolerans]|uniref:thiamine phosphate synthase n=1 Tax=Planococcus halotolerans TaxID=2233542 RepID=UPI001092F756|nr:thiamine phosphate synthase [Planococcus halotolerans]
MCNLFNKPSVYFIMGTQNALGKDPLKVLEEAIKGGITHFQLREKGTGALRGQDLVEFAEKCRDLCTQYQVPFLINDDVDLALAVGANGIHIGQEDMDCGQVRALIGKEKMLGVSVHSLEEARVAIDAGADYLGMGPVYDTRSKADAKRPAGTAGIEEVIGHFPDIPVFGIGGISPQNAPAVWQAGACGVAVISALSGADDIALQITHFKNSYKGVLI